MTRDDLTREEKQEIALRTVTWSLIVLCGWLLVVTVLVILTFGGILS